MASDNNFLKSTAALIRPFSKPANDRAPTREEIQQLLEYPDRRIKPLYTQRFLQESELVPGIFSSGNTLKFYTVKRERLLPQNLLSTLKRQMNIIHSLLLKHLHHLKIGLIFVRPTAKRSVKSHS
jgi:hypothetical protein